MTNSFQRNKKIPYKCCEIYYKKHWKHIVSVVRKILQTKILVSEELDKID